MGLRHGSRHSSVVSAQCRYTGSADFYFSGRSAQDFGRLADLPRVAQRESVIVFRGLALASNIFGSPSNVPIICYNQPHTSSGGHMRRSSLLAIALLFASVARAQTPAAPG